MFGFDQAVEIASRNRIILHGRAVVGLHIWMISTIKRFQRKHHRKSSLRLLTNLMYWHSYSEYLINGTHQLKIQCKVFLKIACFLNFSQFRLVHLKALVIFLLFSIQFSRKIKSASQQMQCLQDVVINTAGALQLLLTIFHVFPAGCVISRTSTRSSF